MATISTDGLTIHYETAGDPAHPPLLIIAGLGDPAGKCAWQAAELADEYFVITPDNRGAGRSDQPPPGYTTADMAGDTAALLDHLGVQAANVFGFSLGGMVAQQLALARPDLVGRLVLGCTTAGGALSVSPEDRVTEAMVNPRSTGDRYADYLAGAWVSCSPGFMVEQPDALQALAELSARFPQSPQGYAGQIQAALAHDVAGRIAHLRLPVLVMHGDADRLIPVENGLALARTIPGAKLILYPGAGHLFFVEQAAAANRDLREFFRSSGPAAEPGTHSQVLTTRPPTETHP